VPTFAVHGETHEDSCDCRKDQLGWFLPFKVVCFGAEQHLKEEVYKPLLGYYLFENGLTNHCFLEDIKTDIKHLLTILCAVLVFEVGKDNSFKVRNDFYVIL
jgi:hypothetical protein